MTVTDRSASAAIKVAVDPLAAFTAFTEEIDSWWVRGAINFFDAARAVEMRIEPGVGGRVLEIYDDARDDALELGRITAWEPGEQLAYRSLVDDTEVDVRFEAIEGGTRVSVTQTLLPDGERAFYFWPNVLRWLVPWCDERDGARPARREIARLSIALYYDDPAAAARWLARVFQLGSWSGIPAEDEDPSWIELHHGDVAILLFPLAGERLRKRPPRMCRGPTSTTSTLTSPTRKPPERRSCPRSSSTAIAPTRPKIWMDAAGPSPRPVRR